MNSSEAAESIVKMSLEGMEVAARITGTGVERIAVALLAMAKQKQMTKGKTNLNNMLKSGNPLQIFSLKQDELKKFHDESKKYGILYTALIDKKHPGFLQGEHYLSRSFSCIHLFGIRSLSVFYQFTNFPFFDSVFFL